MTYEVKWSSRFSCRDVSEARIVLRKADAVFADAIAALS
jgi:hypothetical protein